MKIIIVKKAFGRLNYGPVFLPRRLTPIAALCLLGAYAFADEVPLPLPQGGPALPAAESLPSAETRFLKPTKSIKPPALERGSEVYAAIEPQVNAPTAARLRRLILMPGNLSPDDVRQQILASGQGRKPVTVVGMDAPAPVLTHLAAFFGGDVTADTQKRLLDTVRQGMTEGAKSPRKVEIVGWLPSEGVMAVAVYPES
jgi:hypothetical protein